VLETSKMLKRVTAIWLFFILSLPCLGQQVTDSAYTKTISVLSKDKIRLNKRISLLVSDSFVVYSTFDIVVDNLKKFIKEYDVEEDRELLKKFFDTSKSLEKHLQDIQNDNRLKSRLEFRTADLLENGKCIVYNKVTKTYESQVTITNYRKNWWTGKKFCSLNNQTILDIRTGAY
jgi:hypothetical protein